jgi:peptide/nickel transport system substrate-binding protein
MKSSMRPVLAAVTAAVAVTALAGCAGGGGGQPTGDVAAGKTFTMTMSADPGALDPQMSAVTALFTLTQFAYDSLVSINEKGEIGAQLAEDWKVDGTTVTLTIKDGITCSDGSDFTAKTAADNIAFISDPANQSPFLGAFLPAGVTAEADGSTLTLTLATPAPFILSSLSSLPMVCDAGLADRSTLADATNGTGPFVLTEAVANDHYTYEVNKDYAWGPDGATTAEDGTPAKVVMRIIPNATTAANLVLSGEANAGQVIGPDAARLEGAKLFSTSTVGILGEQWYNEGEGHVTSDPAVRMALVQALDLGELQKVLTSNTGTDATALAVIAPTACNYDAVGSAVPGTDLEAAKAALDGAGWTVGADGIREKDGQKLAITFLYSNGVGAGATAASELAVKAWQDLGVQVDATGQDETTLTGALFGTGAWDVSWVPLNVNNPDQVMGFVSGTPAPDGTNFGGIANADYDAAVTEAMSMTGADGCSTWQSAEEALYKNVDVTPFANSVVKTFGNGAEFEVIGNIVPTSIRMLAGN